MNTQEELQGQWIGPDQCNNGGKHNLVEANMREDGVDYPILKCTMCGWWG